MGRPGRPRAQEEQVQEEQAQQEPGRSVDIATMMYHETEEPRIFSSGEEIPTGWGIHPGGWRQGATGKWINDKVKTEK